MMSPVRTCPAAFTCRKGVRSARGWLIPRAGLIRAAGAVVVRGRRQAARQCRLGQSGALVVRRRRCRKSALLRYAVKTASGFQVLRVRGRVGDGAAYAGLLQLCKPLLRRPGGVLVLTRRLSKRRSACRPPDRFRRSGRSRISSRTRLGSGHSSASSTMRIGSTGSQPGAGVRRTPRKWSRSPYCSGRGGPARRMIWRRFPRSCSVDRRTPMRAAAAVADRRSAG